MILYRIVNKDTGQIYSGLRFYSAVVGKRGKNKGVVMVPGGWTPLWTDPTCESYRDIETINNSVEYIVQKGQMSILDNCEIQSYRKTYLPVKSAVRLEKTRTRLEQKVMIAKLKK